MHSSFWLDAMFWAGVLVELSMLALLCLRQAWKAWPSLGAFCICDLAFDVAIMMNRNVYHRYFYLYWCALAVNAMMRLWVLSNVLNSFPGVKFLRNELRWTVVIAGTLMAAGSAFIALKSTPVFSREVAKAAASLDQCVSIVWGAFFLAALVAVVVFHLGWSRRGAYVANGLLLQVALGLVASHLLALGSHSIATRYLAPVSALLTISLWMYALALPEEVYSVPPDLAATISRGRNQLGTT